MRRKLIVLALLAALVPGVLLTQDELTLTKLHEKIQATEADITIHAGDGARMAERIQSL